MLKENDISIDDLKAIGCDWTNLNTGVQGGVIQYVERFLGRPLQWIICLIHCNELPLRHLFIKFDGGTSNPNEFRGPIGKRIQSCEKLNVVKVNFKFDISKLTNPAQTLSSDQRYLFDICCAIANENCNDALAKRSPGKLNHARWLTLANRTLRLYVSTVRPSANLSILVQHIMDAYTPTFFNIKCKKSVLDGCIHLSNLIKSSQFLPKKYLTIVNSSIQRNAYFAHAENILIAIVNDGDMNVRREGWFKILLARRGEINNEIRQFNIPKINFNCTTYKDMIDFDEIELTVPPLFNQIQVDLDTLDEISEKKLGQLYLDIDLNHTPCHTQAVERCIKIVTEASISLSHDVQRLG